MKKILVSQRVDVVPSYGEHRDALDQRWASFLAETGAVAIPAPNHLKTVQFLLETIVPDGILLSGGNSPVAYGGSAPERDKTDALLIDYAISHKCPLAAVCRGMQSLILHFGGDLYQIEGHVTASHTVSGAISREVNSYHTLAACGLPDSLILLASAPDGAIEAVRHGELPMFAVMWHPERAIPFNCEDITIFKNLWANGEIAL